VVRVYYACAPPPPESVFFCLINQAHLLSLGLPYQGPRPLIYGDDSGRDWDYQPPKHLYEQIKPHLDAHFKSYQDTGRVEKGKGPPYFFLSGAGTGKSRSANEFHQTLIECSRELKNEELERRLRGAKVFHVDLDNGTFPRVEEMENPTGLIGSRMLFQVLRGEEKYRDIPDVTEEFELPSPESVLRLVSRGAGGSDLTAILVVDGIQNLMRSDDDGHNRNCPFYQMLTSLCDLPLSSGFIIVCCTATIHEPMDKFLMRSSRPRIFLELDPLRPPAISGAGVFDMKDSLTRVVVADCGGHARAVSILQSAIEHTSAKPLRVDKSNITDVMAKTCDLLRGRYRYAFKWRRDVFEAALRLILTRTVVRPEQTIPGTEVTVDSLLSPGLVRLEPVTDNAMGMRDSGRLSAPYIWVWALHERAKSEGVLPRDSLLYDWIFREYDQVAISLMQSKGYNSLQSWENFERFCAQFRALKAQVIEDGKEVNLGLIHAGSRFSDENIQMQKFTNRRLRVEFAARRNETKSSLMSSGTEHIIEVREGQTCGMPVVKTVNFKEGRSCVINGAGAPAGDIWLHLDGASANEVQQCKLYGDTTALTTEKFAGERDKSCAPPDFFILYTSRRNCRNVKLPGNSAIVDGDLWNDYFGPFGSRSFLFRSERALQEFIDGGGGNGDS
jgi:hypothetical protein